MTSIENLQELTELDLCFNDVQNRKYYRYQVLFKIPQLRSLDGADISPEEKIKAENLHGLDLNDRETIFKSILPEEEFVDRRINKIDEVEPESEDEPYNVEMIDGDRVSHSMPIEGESVASRIGVVSKRGSQASMSS